MTKIFDDKSRKNLISSMNIGDITNLDINVSGIIIKEISVKEARGYIATFHYSKTMPDSTKYVYGGFYNGLLVGIVCYGMGCGKNQYTSVISDIKNGEYLELTRVWCLHNSPKNTESKIISSSIKMLPKNIKLVVSFADDSRGHCGIIYQATNWIYIGKNKGGKMLIGKDGIEKHPRLIGIYRKRRKEYEKLTSSEIVELEGWKYVDSGVKHKYIYIRGSKSYKKEIIKTIKEKILTYPKCDNNNKKSDLDILMEYKVCTEDCIVGGIEVKQLKWVI